MTSRVAHDLIVIGAGPGGYTLALDAARRGMRTAIVEDRPTLGGTCLNVGCIPSKALLESSEFYLRIRQEALTHGIRIDPKILGVDLAAMMTRKDAVVKQLTGGIAVLMKSRKVDVYHGTGTVVSTGTVRVTSLTGDVREITAPRIVLATGSRPATLPSLPVDGKQIIDSTDALALDRIPGSLTVIGGGAVGLELGSVWSRLGTRVTVIEAMNQIVPGCDSQAARTLAAALKKQGLTILTGTTVETAEVSARGVSLTVRNSKEMESRTISTEKVLVAVGRRANVDGALNGGSVDPRRTADGRFLQVDGEFCTSVEGLYAIGDLIGNPMLAHKAEEDALTLAALFAGEKHPPWGGPVPLIVYTEPELAWAGKTEDELKASDLKYVKGHFPYAANGRALAIGAGDGFVKLLSDAGDRHLVGAVIVGHRASDLLAEVVSVMAMGGCAGDIALTVHGHPTLSEITREAALAAVGRPLHRS